MHGCERRSKMLCKTFILYMWRPSLVICLTFHVH